jgi:hypothetical protein
MTGRCMAFLAAALLLAAPGAAQAGEGDQLRPGFGIDLFASTDADKTDVVKIAANGLLDYRGPDKYLGLTYESAWYKPFGQQTVRKDRFYLNAANGFGDWRWRARIGTDGDTVIGSASIRKADWSQEYSLERDVIETPLGLSQGIYQTFLSASYDIPVDQVNVFTASAGVQAFTGDNVRLHLRGSYIRVLDSKLGLSAQLRTRYYHSTSPGEFDYYSPRDFVQILPLLQLRRFDHRWEYRLQAAYGAQWATGSGWHASRFADLRVTSPRTSENWALLAQVTYTNSTVASGPNYDYVAGSLGITKAF